jgi:putative colanic acid biosynthesis glycosyltransferase
VFKPISSNKRKLLGLDGKCVLVGVASPWSARKGFNDYMKLREQLSDKYVIIMIGLNPKEMSTIPDGIIGIPRTQNQLELAEYYSMADIVLNLSYQETFGMTTVEGMACGTPVIVYKKTASPELLTPGTGIVVEAGNLNNLLQAIETLYKNGKAVYSEKCRERAVQNFDNEKCFEEYIKLYNSVIKK